MPVDRTAFPPDFVWGAATAAYQIEGATQAEGRGESVWDRFSASPGNVRNGDSGEVACDFYHRYPQDVALMADLGLDAFRFSVAWPRVVPEGRGRVSEAGLDFYDRLVDELLSNDIEPFVTLFHWDTPQALEDEGGWTARSTAEAFVPYAEAVVERLGDRVRFWTTHNEPQVVAWNGHRSGEHAPGRRCAISEIGAAHHLLLSHGWAAQAIRAAAPNAQVGITLNLSQVYPASPLRDDEEAAWFLDGQMNRWYIDPLFRGAYPEDLADRQLLVGRHLEKGDLEAIAAPLDFLGINNYSRLVVTGAPEGPRVVSDPDVPRTEMGWEVYPDGLHELLVRVAEDYGPPAIYVTENGAAFSDVRVHDGRIHDPERTAYLASHVEAVARAIADGAPVRGYFVWSLLDNFEWAHGYSKRFGLIYVDYPTLERVPKDSFFWYRDFIASRPRVIQPAPAAAR